MKEKIKRGPYTKKEGEKNEYGYGVKIKNSTFEKYKTISTKIKRASLIRHVIESIVELSKHKTFEDISKTIKDALNSLNFKK